jgi:hypothetical protein
MSILLKKIFKRLAVSSLLVTPVTYASVIEGYGEHAINEETKITMACALAETKAIENAFEKYAERELVIDKKSYCFDTASTNYCSYFKQIESNKAGTIKQIIKKTEQVEHSKCKTNIEVEIMPSEFFNISLKGKNVYKAGEELDFTINTSQEYFVYIFSMHSKGVDLLFQFNYTDNNAVNGEFVLSEKGKKYVTYLDSWWSSKAEESLLFLFTKHELVFDRFNFSGKVLEDTIKALPIHTRRVIIHKILIER